MWQGGSKRNKTLRYLKEASGKPILPKDVENLIAEMRRETYTSLDDNVHVSELLRYFGESPVNAVNTFRDQATKMTSCITFQIAHMRRMARKFPEALCMDATHGTSINRYRLFSFMVTNNVGTFAQHTLIAGETKLNMKSAFKAFKQSNAAWIDVKVVIIDKDFTKLDFFAEELPNATNILCHFHIIDYLKREASKRDYGFTLIKNTHVRILITMMVRTEDER
ncbi:hypothetical protein Pcac1_g10417 [Phytophthora cactorum]|nr:hypothetical protein Pcac1_g10417 [Phytophthora cactorum]